MKKTLKGFSLVELIISISIIVIISAIAVTNYSGMQDNSNNSKVSSDLKSLENSFLSYLTENEQLPLPDGNQKFYEEDTSYSHNYEDGSTFGVSGFVSENTLPKKYLNYLPTDPNTNQYYGYAKTKDFLAFEVSGVVTKDGVYKAIVIGNWGGEKGPFNLIRDHISPNFVYDNSTEYFPYNPKEKLLIGKINSFSGELKINNRNISQAEINEIEIRQLDEITISTGGIVDIYSSDGSNFKLGDNTSSSQLVLTNMKYNSDNNMFTSLKLLLNFGGIWTKSPKMAGNSDFEVYTPDAVASVRGTIFGVTKNINSTNIVLVKGKIEVNKINTPTDLVKNLKEETDISTSTLSGSSITIEDGKSFLIVKELDEIKGLEYYNIPGATNQITNNTGSLNQIPDEVKDDIINGGGDLNENIQLNINDLEYISSYTGSIFIEESKLLNSLINSNIYIKNKSESGLESRTKLQSNYYSTGVSLNIYDGKNIISICNNLKEEKCTKSTMFNIDKAYEEIENLTSETSNKIDKTEYKNIEFDNGTVKYGSGTSYTNEQKVRELNFLYKDVLGIKSPKKEFDIYYNYSNIDYNDFIKNIPEIKNKIYKNLLKNVYKIEGKITDEKLKLRFGLSYDETKNKIENHLNKKFYEIYAYDGYNNYPFSPKITTGTISTGGILSKNIIPSYDITKNTFPIDSSILSSSLPLLDTYILSGSKNLSFNQNIITDNGKKGIFINNNGRDNLYYQLDSSYSNYKNIAFELNVRGAALNRRDSKNYTLLGFDNQYKYIFINNREIKFKLNSYGDTKIDYIPKDIDNNKYYKIRIYLKKDNYIFFVNKIEIYDDNNNKKSSININSYNFKLSLDELKKIYVGSSNSGEKNQWNDIIDYFKIYVKKI